MIRKRYRAYLLALMLAIASGGLLLSKSSPPPSTQPPAPPDVNTQAPSEPRDKSEIVSTMGQESTVIVKDIVDSLKRRDVALSAPIELTVNESGQVDLVVTNDLENIDDHLKTRGQYFESQTKVSNRMKATLTAPDADVRAIGSEEKLVGYEDVAWAWRVQPKKAGDLSLNVRLSAMISVNGEKGTYDISTFNKVVDVKVSRQSQVADFLSSNWQWGFTVLLLPLGKFAWSKVKT